MKECISFVLGGGGSRGALQVGALKALLDIGIKPDLLIGSSIGAVNAAGFALWGVDLKAIEKMEDAWNEMANAQGIPVHRFTFEGASKKPIWDFSDEKKLIQKGYQITKEKLEAWGYQKQSTYQGNRAK